MTATELFERHVRQADKIASDTCHHYRISGAMAYQDEARSEARIALWRQAERFDPHKQVVQRKQAEHDYWAAILGVTIPPAKFKNPYDIFWFSAVTRVRGSVIDFFRSQRLITKLVKTTDGSEPVHTILYYNRFVSTSKSVADGSNDHEPGGMETLGDQLVSLETADRRYNERHDSEVMLKAVFHAGGLTDMEKDVLGLSYGNEECSTLDISKRLKISEPSVKRMKKEAILKLKTVALASCGGAFC